MLENYENLLEDLVAHFKLDGLVLFVYQLLKVAYQKAETLSCERRWFKWWQA